MMSLLKRAIPALALFLLVPQAQASLPGVVSHVLPDGGQSWSLPVQALLFLTLLGFIPALLLYYATHSGHRPHRRTRFCWDWPCF